MLDSETTTAPANPDRPGAFDKAAALARVEGDEELLRELVELFLGDCARLLADVRAAIEQGDAGQLYRAAHTLKGAASNFVAPGVTAAALALETQGRNGILGEAPQAFQTLTARLDELKHALADLAMPSAA